MFGDHVHYCYDWTAFNTYAIRFDWADRDLNHYEHINLVDFITDLEWEMDYTINKEVTLDPDDGLIYHVSKKPEVLNALKEELLNCNVCSFTYDW